MHCNAIVYNFITFPRPGLKGRNTFTGSTPALGSAGVGADKGKLPGLSRRFNQFPTGGLNAMQINKLVGIGHVEF